MNKKTYYTKDELLNYIYSDNFHIYENEYDILVEMIEELDDKLFTKIFEEIVLGNLSISDFKPLFMDKQFKNVLVKSIESQKDFNERYQMFVSYIEKLHNLNAISDKISYDSLVAINKDEINNNIVNIEKRNKIMSLFTNNIDDPLKKIYTNDILYDFIKSNISLDDFLLSIDTYVVPIDFKYIEITDSDLEYARLNNLSLDLLKKTKALALYYTNKYLREKSYEETSTN